MAIRWERYSERKEIKRKKELKITVKIRVKIRK